LPEIAEVKIFTDQLNKEFGGQALQNIEIVGGRFLKKPIEKFHQLTAQLMSSRYCIAQAGGTDTTFKISWSEA
jgi:formamidopyrimidine-DNA glycosylase